MLLLLLGRVPSTKYTLVISSIKLWHILIYFYRAIIGRNKEYLFFVCLQILRDSYNFFKKRAVFEGYNFLNRSFMKAEHFARIICTFIASEWSQEQVLTPWSRENWCFRRNLSPVPRLSRPLPSRYTDWVIATPNFTYVTQFFCPDIGDFCHMTGFVRVKSGLPVSHLLFMFVKGVWGIWILRNFRKIQNKGCNNGRLLVSSSVF